MRGGVRRRHWGAVTGLALALALGTCGEGPTAANLVHQSPRVPNLSPPPVAVARSLVETFMADFQSRDFADQWNMLSPLARTQWPSEPARTAMLQAKFGAAPVSEVESGDPVAGATWASPEDLATASGLWRVPVTVTFTDPEALRPAGVASAYVAMSVYVSTPADGIPEVVGEGPTSLDGPLLLPPSVPTRHARVPILMYHRIAPYPDPARYRTAYDYHLDYGLTVSPEEFAGQVSYLVQHGYAAISLTRLADNLLYGLPLPARPVIFTFDDGRESALQNAVPILQQHGYTAMFFVPTGLMGATNNTQHYITSEQVTALVTAGFWVEDHTQKDNVALWGLTQARLKPIVSDSRQQLQGLAGVPVQFIAYTGLWPYPSPTGAGAAERQLFSQLEQFGYVGGLIDSRQDSDLELGAQLWQLPRLRVNPREGLSTFANLL